MKKQTITLLCLLLTCIAATAQTVSFDIHPANKVSKSITLPLFIGCDNNRIIRVEDFGRRTNDYSLIAYNHDMVEQSRVDLSSGDFLEAYGGYINGQHIDLLFADRSNNGMRVYRDRHCLATLQAEDTLDLVSLKGEKGDDFAFTIAVSPNGKLLAGIFLARYQAQTTDLRVALYNRELEEYWNMSVPSATFNNVSLTDDGDIILYTLGDKDGKALFTIVDGENIRHHEFRIEPEEESVILERAFLRYGNGKIIIATTVRQENHAIMPVGSNIDRVDIHSFDIGKNTISTHRHPFTDQETQRLCNSKEGKALRHHWVQFGQIDKTIADNEGAYLMLSQSWTVTQNGIPTEYHTCGMMVLRVDADGNISWTRTQRYSAIVNWGWRRAIIPHWRSIPDGIMLAWADNAKNVTIPDGKSCNDFKPSFHKSTLNVWILHPDGRETQSYIQTDRMFLDGSVHPLDTPGKYLATLRNMRKTQLAFITIE